MMKLKDYKPKLIERLKDRTYAIEYLMRVHEEDDPDAFGLAIRHVAEAMSMTQSKPDWKRLERMSDSEILLSEEHPEATLEQAVKGIVRKGFKPVPAKTSISLRIDPDVLEWFRSQGPGYQTRINAVLKAYRDASL